MFVDRMDLKRCFVIACMIMGFSPLTYAQSDGGALSEVASHLSSSDCIACHQSQHERWLQSDHAYSMALATEATVKADFNDQEVSHYAQQAYFFKEGEQFKARIKNAQAGESKTYTVKYTFGYYPLQQYLVEIGQGKLQVLPFAWDTREASEGGQRWYHNYSSLEVKEDDRLHWLQAMQNYNGMCADCHSDQIKRNYSPQTDTFATTYTGINVSCVSCHGVDTKKWGDNHPSKTVSTSSEHQALSASNKALSRSLMSDHKKQGIWRFDEQADSAQWHGEARDNAFMDTCFACHSLRSPLTDGYTPNTAFLDNYSPTLITPPFYHADGQIKEEVYVYGSFLQSKMFEQGVNCLDCHDSHTMKVKVQGNGLCLQCHKAQVFDVPEHHRHPVGTEAALCVNCHMPDETYMGVDARRDHSFKIPRPDLSSAYNTPNACTNCHQDKSHQWAAQALEQWHGGAKALSTNRKNLLKLRSGQSINLIEHLTIAHDESIDVITRASVIEILDRTTQALVATNLTRFVEHSEDLIRLAAARVAYLVPANRRVELLSPLLADKRKAVRVAAARQLVGIDVELANTQVFAKAFAELLDNDENSAWRSEGRINQAKVSIALGDRNQAIGHLQKAIDIDAYFSPAYLYLSDIYRSAMQEDIAGGVLAMGLEKLPASAELVYAYGLHKVRAKDLAKATQLFRRSMSLDPSNPSYAYTYVLALDTQGKTQTALRELQSLLPSYQGNDQRLQELSLYLSRKVSMN